MGLRMKNFILGGGEGSLKNLIFSGVFLRKTDIDGEIA